MSNERVKSGLFGVLPDGWSAVRLGHIGLFLRGGGGSKQDEVDDGLPCVRYGDLYTHHDCRITDTRSRISPDRVNSYTPLRYGDVLFASSGETVDDIGRSAVNLMSGRAYCGGDVIILRPAIEVNSSFLGHVADCASSRIQKSRLGRGSTVIHIYDEELRDLVIPVPPLEEQQRIAEILDSIDEAIQATERVVAKLNRLRRGVSDNLLDSLPLNSSLVSGLERIDAGWSPSCVDRPPLEGEWGVLKVSAVTSEVFDPFESKTLPTNLRHRPEIAAKVGDVLTARANGVADLVARTAIVEDLEHKNLMISDKTLRLVPGPTLSARYLVLCMQHEMVRSQVRGLVTGSTGQGNISQEELFSLRIAIPELRQQKEIERALFAIDTRIATERHNIKKLRWLRSGLSADLLSGRVRTVAA